MEKVALIVTFPDSPAELPKEVYDCAYHKDAPNTRSETWRAGIGSAELPARSTHQKVRGSNPTATQGGQQNLTPQDMMGMMMTFANAIAGNAASSNMNVGQLSGLRVLGMQGSRKPCRMPSATLVPPVLNWLCQPQEPPVNLRSHLVSQPGHPLSLETPAWKAKMVRPPRGCSPQRRHPEHQKKLLT